MDKLLARSFGRRKARKLRPQSQKAYDEILPLLRIDLKKKLFDNDPADVWLEIGFGGGEHMLAQLAKNPSISMVGCEPFTNGVAKLLAHLPCADYGRVRLWPEDVRLLLEVIPPSYFTRIFILFPDPWPKKRHTFRRLITFEFMETVLPTLKDGGLLYVASDDVSYIKQIQEVLYPHPKLVREQGPPSADPATWEARGEDWPIMTRYEEKALLQNKPCAYMVFRKQGSVNQKRDT